MITAPSENYGLPSAQELEAWAQELFPEWDSARCAQRLSDSGVGYDTSTGSNLPIGYHPAGYDVPTGYDPPTG